MQANYSTNKLNHGRSNGYRAKGCSSREEHESQEMSTFGIKQQETEERESPVINAQSHQSAASLNAFVAVSCVSECSEHNGQLMHRHGAASVEPTMCNGAAANPAIADAQPPASTWLFVEDDERYIARACCDCMTLRSGALVVGLIQCLLCLAWIALAIVYHRIVSAQPGATWLLPLLLHIAGAVVSLVIVAVMLYGLKTERPYLMLPQVILTMAGIAAGVLLTFAAVVCMAVGTASAVAAFGAIFGDLFVQKAKLLLGPIWPFCLAVIFDSGAAVCIWFYNVVFGAYIYLCDKKFSESGYKTKYIWHPRSAKVQKSS